MGRSSRHFLEIRESEGITISSPKSEIEKGIDKCIEEVDNGNTSYLDAVLKLRKYKEFFDSQLSKIKEWEDKNKGFIQAEAEDYGNEYKDAKFEFRSGGRIFKFDHIKEIADTKNQLKSLEDKYRMAWENKQKGLLNVTEDGEVLELPEVSYKKDSMIVKFKK